MHTHNFFCSAAAIYFIFHNNNKIDINIFVLPMTAIFRCQLYPYQIIFILNKYIAHSKINFTP